MTATTERATATDLPDDPQKKEKEEYEGRAFDLAYSSWLLARSDEVRALDDSLDDKALEASRRRALTSNNAERALFMAPCVDCGDLWKKLEAIEFAAVEELAQGPLARSNLLLGLGAFKNDLLAILDPDSREASR